VGAIPATNWRSPRKKNASAGSIASIAYARTRAVSAAHRSPKLRDSDRDHPPLRTSQHHQGAGGSCSSWPPRPAPSHRRGTPLGRTPVDQLQRDGSGSMGVPGYRSVSED
jgi:hypothetical protein